MYNHCMTTLTPKYSYSSLTRDNSTGIRLYSTPDGEKLPSVTTILDKTKDPETVAALAKWRAAVGEEKAKQITTEAANRGTRMHSYLEQYVLEGAMPTCGSNPYAKVSHLMAETIVNLGMSKVPEVWGSEASLYYPGLYAGTTDLVGVWHDRPAIIDFKQSNKIKKWEDIDDYKCQLVAYGLAHNKLYGTDIRTGVVLMAVKPEIDAKFNIIKPPSYLEFVLEGDEWDQYVIKWLDKVQEYHLGR